MGAVALLAFAVSTAHYGMNWALMVANNTFNQLLLETTANAEASDGEIPIILVPSAAVSAYYQAIRLAAALLYTPVINVSPFLLLLNIFVRSELSLFSTSSVILSCSGGHGRCGIVVDGSSR